MFLIPKIVLLFVMIFMLITQTSQMELGQHQDEGKLQEPTTTMKPPPTPELKDYVVDCEQRNFQDSIDYCSSQGCTISSFHSDDDINSVKDKITCKAYIGATSDGNGHWSYVDGTEWWAYSENDGLAGTTETKVVWNDDGTGWHDWGTGDALHGVICQQCQATCNDLQFTCINDQQCIDASYKCDGYLNCDLDGSDELYCPECNWFKHSTTVLEEGTKLKYYEKSYYELCQRECDEYEDEKCKSFTYCPGDEADDWGRCYLFDKVLKVTEPLNIDRNDTCFSNYLSCDALVLKIKGAEASSKLPSGQDFFPEKAIDKNLKTSFIFEFIDENMVSEYLWLQIELEECSEVQRVHIFISSEPLRNEEIRIGNTKYDPSSTMDQQKKDINKNDICKPNTKIKIDIEEFGKRIEIPCEKTLLGNFVSVQSLDENSKVMQINEMVVYGKTFPASTSTMAGNSTPDIATVTNKISNLPSSKIPDLTNTAEVLLSTSAVDGGSSIFDPSIVTSKESIFTSLSNENVTEECCDPVYLSSDGIQSAIDGNNPTSIKLGQYNYQQYSNGRRAYKLMTNKTDQEKEFFLHFEPLSNKWAVSDVMGKNKSYIYHPKCDEVCPEDCPHGIDSSWKIVIRERPWDEDPKLKATCDAGNIQVLKKHQTILLCFFILLY